MSLKEFASDSGAAIVDAVDLSAADFGNLDLSMIVEDPRNVRKAFNQAKLEELADSIRAGGVRQAILVRPLPASRLQETFEGRRKGTPLPSHELVDGARRFRASKLAGKTVIPAMIKAMTDAEVLEAQLVANLQRDDLSELEEADGYQRLVEDTGVAKEDIGAKIGKSRAYVYGRLKLLDLTSESRQALADDKLDASRALLIARIPDAKLQKKALAEAMKVKYDGSPLLSVREFQRWLHDNVMLKLEQARFDIKDDTLHATAGPCKACPKRTGADPDLFSDVQGADICTDPKCYETKASVHRDRLVAKAESKGMTIIEGKEAKELCNPYGTAIKGYSRLDQKREDVDSSGPTLRKLLGKDGPTPVLIEHPYTKELIEVVPTAEADAVLVAKGELKPSQTATRASLEDQIDRLKEQDEYNGPKVVREKMFAAIQEGVRLTPDDKVRDLVVPELVRVWLIRQVESFDAGDTLVKVLNLKVDGEGYEANNKTAIAAMQAASDANLFRALVLVMADDESTFYFHSNRCQSTPAMASIAAGTGVDLAAVEASAEAQRKTTLRSAIAMLKANAEPKKPKVKPATSTSESVKGKGGKKSAAPPAAQAQRAKRKPSKEEVQSDIAEALQALDKAPTGAAHEEVAVDAAKTDDQAPDGAPKEEAAVAAGALDPRSFWPFPSKSAP